MTHSTAFSPGAEASKAQLYSTTRNQVLDQVTEKAQKKQVSKRMEGKVGIITGVGPEAGIGVGIFVKSWNELESVAHSQSNAAKLMAREGARHLYLLDFSKQVESFSETLHKDFPGTKVSAQLAQASVPLSRPRARD